MADYVTYDFTTGNIEVSLPDEHKDRYMEIFNELMDEFGYDSITPELLVKMNLLVKQKLNAG